MNIVETFSLKYQGEELTIQIEKINKSIFIGHTNITLGKKQIEYNQAGCSPEQVKQKMIDFFTDKKITKQVNASNS